MAQEVLFEINDQTAIITLNRPERRNAINQSLLTQLYDCIERVSNDEAIKVGIITGSGQSFCSGIDLACLETDNLFDPRGDGLDMPQVFASCNKPLIGAINGYAITGGFEIALNCDFLIASENAVFADTHAKVGIHPGWGMTQLLQQAVGQKMAKQFSLTCQLITAEKALGCGLVNEVVSAALLLSHTEEVAAQIAGVNYDMAMTVKKLIENRNSNTFEGALAIERKDFLEFVDKYM